MPAAEYVLAESLSTGIKATEEMEATPYGWRVTWIQWNSGFRGSGLAIGDRILGVDGWLYERAKRKDFSYLAIGEYGEHQHWEKTGGKESQLCVLTVWRESGTIAIEGALHNDRHWENSAGRRCLGPEGPDQLAYDGYDSGWGGWYDKLVDRMSRVLDGG